ncbi:MULTISPECIES: glycosyltransferase family 2 protein [Haloferax]|uniref:Glycosyltransferase n=2 Tax=Haloferax TaxID=2251 RepID=A0A6G1Z7B6_9EURY|nr:MULTISPECIES: glycosyltransferase family 2 protein [Haloferax]KAB1185114.1 glycosyltransferase family 2 protein [Haloferax sp. CBA1149]MRW82291.1 glycosyltransferase [Haloferax marinisediminis]
MYKGNTISVVIPAYNESDFIGEVLERIPTYVDRVYVVDDGSTDRTWEEIQSHAALSHASTNGKATGEVHFDQRIVPIRHTVNRGVGGAIKTGYLHAREDQIDITAVMGGDGQMDPDHLPDLLDPIVEGRADYAKANRLTKRENRSSMPTFRFVGNVILSGLTKIASGYWRISDPQNGYTAISLEALEQAPIEEMYEFYGYCNDLLAKLNSRGLRVVDVPIVGVYGDEKSHIRYQTYIPRVSAMLLRTFIWRLRESYLRGRLHPVPLLYLTGVVGILFGVLRVGRKVAGADVDKELVARTTSSLLGGGLSLAIAMMWEAHLNRNLGISKGDQHRENVSRDDD